MARPDSIQVRVGGDAASYRLAEWTAGASGTGTVSEIDVAFDFLANLPPGTTSAEIAACDSVEFSLQADTWVGGQTVSYAMADIRVDTAPLAAVSTPTFGPDSGGRIGNSVRVTLTSTTPGATIHYTLDGSDPDAGDPAVVSGDVVEVPVPGEIRAIGIKDGWNPSAIARATYTAAEIVFSPDHIDFGDVLIGESRTRSFTVRNVGVDTVTLDPLDFDNGFITCFFPGAVLEPGESVVIDITYTPLLTREAMATEIEIIGSTFSGTITIAGNDTTDPGMLAIGTVDVPVFGTGQIVVPVNLTVDEDLCMTGFQVLYDNSALTAVEYRQAGRTIPVPQAGGINDATGTVTFAFGQLDGSLAIPAGSGPIAEIVFERKPDVEAGTYPLSIANVNNVYTTAFQELTPGAQHGEVSLLPYEMGDVDKNGVLNALDAIFIYRTVSFLPPIPPGVPGDGLPTNEEIAYTVWNELGDYNGDGVVNALDAIDLYRHVSGLPPRGGSRGTVDVMSTNTRGATRANALSVISTQALPGASGVVVQIALENDSDLCMLGFRLNYDTSVLNAVSYGKAGRTVPAAQAGGIDDTAGTVTFAFGQLDGSLAIAAGTGAIAEVVFDVEPGATPDDYALALSNVNNAFTTGFADVTASIGTTDGIFTVEAEPTNTVPVAIAQGGVLVAMNGAVDLELHFVDPEIDGGSQTATFDFPTPPTHGALSVTRGFGAYTYTPTPGYTGPDNFSFTVFDGEATSAEAEVQLYVHDGWAMNLAVTNGDRKWLQIGAMAGLAEGFNAGHDLTAPPDTGNAYTATLVDPAVAVTELERDMRGSLAGQRWQAHLRAAAEPGDITVSWNPDDLPPSGLVIFLLDGENGNPAGPAQDMATVTSIVVPAGEERWYGIAAPLAFEVQQTPVTVPEGGSNTVAIRLTGQPSADVTAQVSRSSGDTDLSADATPLVFTPADWDQWQLVAISAAEDADATNGAAQFAITQTAGPVPVSEAIFEAIEADNEVILTIAKDGNGTVDNEGENIIDLAAGALPFAISARANAGAIFQQWTIVGDVTMEDAGSPDTRVTAMTGSGTVTAIFVDGEPLAIETATPAVSTPVVVDEGDTASFSITATGGIPPYAYEWRVGGAIQAGAETTAFDYQPDYDVVAHPAKTDGVEIVCTVTDSAGARAAVSATWSDVTVRDVDRLPPAPTVAMAPATPDTGADVVASVTGQEPDPDGDAISGHTFVWTSGAKTVNDATLPASQTVKDETWTVAVNAMTNPYGDGDIPGAEGTAQVTIGNTAPVIADVNPVYCRQGQSIEIQLVATDPDVDDGVDTLDWDILPSPANGTATIDDTTGILTYTAAADSAGPDTFTVLVGDGTDTDTTEVTVTVIGWWLEISLVQGRADTSVIVGLMDGATEGVDDVDRTAAPEAAILALSPDADMLSVDFLGALDGRPWLLMVDALSGDTLEWDSEAVPSEGLVLGRP